MRFFKPGIGLREIPLGESGQLSENAKTTPSRNRSLWLSIAKKWKEPTLTEPWSPTRDNDVKSLPSPHIAMFHGIDSIKVDGNSAFTFNVHNHQSGANEPMAKPCDSPNHSDSNACPLLARQPRDEYRMYCEELMRCGVDKEDVPIWAPGPSRRLPAEYQRSGISVGDVGIISKPGVFEFLFNIFHPADGHINQGRVPGGFAPFSEDDADIQEYMSHGQNSCLMSQSFRKTILSDSSFKFESRDQEGAILVMPEGATHFYVGNDKLIDDYIAAHSRNWYQEISRKRHVENGSIFVIVECDKVPSWGIATFATTIKEQVCLEFKRGADGTQDAFRTYAWYCHGAGNGRAGPQEEDLRDLAPMVPMKNQCVFIRARRVAFPEILVTIPEPGPVIYPFSDGSQSTIQISIGPPSRSHSIDHQESACFLSPNNRLVSLPNAQECKTNKKVHCMQGEPPVTGDKPVMTVYQDSSPSTSPPPPDSHPFLYNMNVPQPAKPKRSTMACIHCRERKVKCDNNNDGLACERCKKNKRECRFVSVAAATDLQSPSMQGEPPMTGDKPIMTVYQDSSLPSPPLVAQWPEVVRPHLRPFAVDAQERLNLPYDAMHYTPSLDYQPPQAHPHGQYPVGSWQQHYVQPYSTQSHFSYGHQGEDPYLTTTGRTASRASNVSTPLPVLPRTGHNSTTLPLPKGSEKIEEEERVDENKCVEQSNWDEKANWTGDWGGEASWGEDARWEEKTKWDEAAHVSLDSLDLQTCSFERTSSPYMIYYTCLLLKGRGVPLWVPEPNRRLPVEYRTLGITIGDVGVIDQSGAFNFLFNILFPAQHPINRGKVPQAFSPLELSEEAVEEKDMCSPGTFFTSSSLVGVKHSIDSSQRWFKFEFTSADRSGAVLVLPDGAISQDLSYAGLKAAEKHANENAKYWYDYITQVRGRTIDNNSEILFVVGCDKVSSWGIATFTTCTEQVVHLVLKAPDNKVASSSKSSPAYIWECHSSGNGRVGPTREGMSGLTSYTLETPPRNQCIFIRTMKVTGPCRKGC